MIEEDISSQIVIVGTNPAGKGGIATAVAAQKAMMETFNFIEVHRDGWMKFLLPLFGIIKAFRFVGNRYKLVHIHSASKIDFYRSSLYVVLFKLLGKNVLLHLHGGKFEDFYLKNKRFVAYICNLSDGLATVSSYFVRFCKQSKLNKRVWLIPNSISEIKTDIVNYDCKTTEKREFVFSYFGALDNRKGIFDVVKTMSEFRRELPDNVKLYIGGNGDVSYLRRLISENMLEEQIRYLGWLDKEAKDRLLRGTDVFIHPSEFESFGISILEAMSYGLPVITTSVGGIPDLVTDGENGIVVEAGNRRQIADAMVRLISDSQLRNRMRRRSIDIASKFCVPQVEAILRDTYRQML